jgi:hypothetical protein
MRRFFLALRVGGEVVARPLPHVLQAVQGPAQGALRDALLGQALQGRAEQRHRPGRVRRPEILGGEGEEGLQHVLLVLVQQRRASPAAPVPERQGVARLGVGVDPVIDTLAGYPEHPRQLRGRAALVEFQDSQGAAIDADVRGLRQLTPEAPPLPRGQDELTHGLLLDHPLKPCNANTVSN